MLATLVTAGAWNLCGQTRLQDPLRTRARALGSSAQLPCGSCWNPRAQVKPFKNRNNLKIITALVFKQTLPTAVVLSNPPSPLRSVCCPSELPSLQAVPSRRSQAGPASLPLTCLLCEAVSSKAEQCLLDAQ